jgi:hypothetical protein
MVYRLRLLAACQSSMQSPVGAAEGCDLLIWLWFLNFRRAGIPAFEKGTR